jgi:methanogenic corrinoid protein MtbC1
MARSGPDYLPPWLREADTRPRYNTAAVVRTSGVPAATFRAWERRYGFPRPERLPAGQRLYSERDVAAIRWLHEQTERGLTISRAVALVLDALAGAEQRRPVESVGRPTTDLAADLGAALLSADQTRADGILAEAFALYPIETVALEVMEPLLIEVGERWHRAELSVADEHYVTNYLLRKLFALFNAYDGRTGRGLIVTACAPGEWHEVGILIVSLFLARQGYRVLYLGPNLPLESLAAELPRLRPDLVCLSAATAETARSLIRGMHQFVRPGNGTPPFAVGGRAFRDDPSLLAQVPGDYLGPNAREALGAVERFLGGNGRA